MTAPSLADPSLPDVSDDKRLRNASAFAKRMTTRRSCRAFYAGRAGDEWLAALAALGTDADKPFLTDAPALIVAFAQRKGEDGAKHCDATEGVGLACGLLNASRT